MDRSSPARSTAPARQPSPSQGTPQEVSGLASAHAQPAHATVPPPDLAAPAPLVGASRPNRPRLALLKPKLTIGTGSQASASKADVRMDANGQLESDKNAIVEHLKATPPHSIQRDGAPPSLAAVREVGHDATHFSTSNSGEDFFINATSKGDAGKSTFDKHKVHLSVDKAQFDKAYEALAPLLFSKESPIHRFKLTDMERAAAGPQSEASERVTQGAQFTLYLKSNPQTGHYDAQQMHALKSFISQCEGALTDAGVSRGSVPKSDVSLGSHASYRSEAYERDDSQVEQMAREPMCTVLQTRLPGAPRSEAD